MRLRRMDGGRWGVGSLSRTRGGIDPLVRLQELPEPLATWSAATREDVIDRVRDLLDPRFVLTVEEAPDLVGVAEAAEILGWDKRRVATYIRRGSFPEALATLRSGRVWPRKQIEGFADDYRERQEARARRARRRAARD